MNTLIGHWNELNSLDKWLLVVFIILWVKSALAWWERRSLKDRVRKLEYALLVARYTRRFTRR